VLLLYSKQKRMAVFKHSE